MNIIQKTSTRNTTYCPGRKIKYLAIHYTAGTTSREGSATNVATYFGTVATNGSADFAVDDVQAVQYNPDPRNYYCWAVGDSLNSYYGGGKLYGIATNANTISIEICSSNTTGTITQPNDAYFYFTDAAVNKAIELTKYLMKEYNISADNVCMHFSISGKPCPGVRGWGTDGGDDSKWQAFKKAISSGTTTTTDTSKFTKIMGTAKATVEQMTSYIKSVNKNVPQSVLDMIPLYILEGKAEGVRGDIAFAQSCLETGNFGFGGGTAVTLDQNNFCGMGVTQLGLKGNSFATPQLGIRAQIQHLKAYGSTEALKLAKIDPRFDYVKRNSATYVEWLGIPDNPNGVGWAGGQGYGAKILAILDKILAQKSTTATTTPLPLYRIRKSWKDSASQIGAYNTLELAKDYCKDGYFVFDADGNVVYPEVKTLQKVKITATLPVVEEGVTGYAVKVLQALFGLTVDGKWNTKLEEKLKAWQTKQKLEADGVCGENTWKKVLTSVLNNTKM